MISKVTEDNEPKQGKKISAAFNNKLHQEHKETLVQLLSTVNDDDLKEILDEVNNIKSQQNEQY